MNEQVAQYLAQVPKKSESARVPTLSEADPRTGAKFSFARKDTICADGILLFGNWNYFPKFACTLMQNSALAIRVLRKLKILGAAALGLGFANAVQSILSICLRSRKNAA